MKLYTFLLIDDDIIADENIFKTKNSTTDIISNDTKRNRIYIYRDNPDIALMSFKYPNIDKKLDLTEISYKWAYTLIDDTPDMEIKLLKEKWGTNVDKKGEKIESITLIKSTRIQYLRVGGHIGNTKHRLHEYIFFGRDKNDFKPQKERIHHKGHSFDNRVKYLERVTISKHRLIHNKLEPNNSIIRPRNINLIGNNEIRDYLSSDAVLIIKTEEQLREFIMELTSKDYKRFGSKYFYEDMQIEK